MPSRPLDRAPRVSWSGHSAYVYIKMRKSRRGEASCLTSQNFIQSTAPLVTAPRRLTLTPRRLESKVG